jgi:hypothetical protein
VRFCFDNIRRLFRHDFARWEKGFFGTAPAKQLHGIAINMAAKKHEPAIRF